MSIRVLVQNYGPEIMIWPKGRMAAQLVSWMVLHSGIVEGVITGWRRRSFNSAGDQIWPYIITSRHNPTLPKAWGKRLEKKSVRCFDAILPTAALAEMLAIPWEQAEAARDDAEKLPVTYTGEFYYVVGTGKSARTFLYRSQLDYTLAPQSILDPWEKILREGEAWFYFDGEV